MAWLFWKSSAEKTLGNIKEEIGNNPNKLTPELVKAIGNRYIEKEGKDSKKSNIIVAEYLTKCPADSDPAACWEYLVSALEKPAYHNPGDFESHGWLGKKAITELVNQAFEQNIHTYRVIGTITRALHPTNLASQLRQVVTNHYGQNEFPMVKVITGLNN